MSYRSQLGLFISAIGSVLVVAIYNLATHAKIDPILAAAISIGTNVILVALSAQWLLVGAMRYRPYRRLFDPRAKFEGYWLGKVQSLADRPYAISVISYNPASATYVYSGRAFSGTFDIVADWGSTQLEFDLADSRIRYLHEGALLAGSDVIQGYGYIFFDRTPRGEVLTARGFFVDIDQKRGANYHHYTMHRITGNDIIRSVPTDRKHGRWRKTMSLASDNDYKAIVQHLVDP